MKRDGKKLLSVLLVFVLIMSMFPAATIAAGSDPEETPDPAGEQELLPGWPETDAEEEAPENGLLLEAASVQGGERGVQNFFVLFDPADDPETGLNALGDYVWAPASTASGHQFKYIINYVLSGNFSYNAEELEIRIPKSILRDRDGHSADECDLSVPYYNDPNIPDNRVFVYREEGDEFVIYNRIGCSAAQNGYIDVGYYTSKPTYEYMDYDPAGAAPEDRNTMTPDPFYAQLTVSRPGEAPESVEDTADPLFIDTAAQLYSVVKKPLPQGHYSNWVSSWGQEPADAADYSYVIWEIKSYITATQRYNFTLSDETLGCVAPAGNDVTMEVYGYKMQGQSVFTPSASGEVTLYNQTEGFPNGRYDYVLTRHLKSDCAGLSEYTLKNQATGTVHPLDRGDDTTAVSTSTWSYVQPVFHPSFGTIGAFKSGLDFQNRTVTTSDQIRNFRLDEFRLGHSDTIDDLAWNAGFSNSLYYLTATDPNDPATYAVNPVTYELYDNTLSLKAFGTSSPYAALTADNYYISKVQISWTMTDADFDDENKVFVPKPADYTGEKLEAFAQFGGDTSAWIKVGEYDLENYSGSLTPEGEAHGVQWAGQTLRFPSGVSTAAADRCTGYRLVTSNKHYSVTLTATPHVTLTRILPAGEATDVVTAAVEDAYENGQKKIVVSNSATSNAYAGGFTGEQLEAQNPAPAKSGTPSGVCYAIGIVRTGSISKSVRYTPQVVFQRCKLTWTVNVQESYQDTFGTTVYVPQSSGVFYDVLPLGSIFDASTLYVSADGTEILPGDYTYTLTDNWRDSGRTLLTLTILEPAEQEYEFNYATYHTWNDLVETGKTKKNLVAYETGNDDIGNGRPDAPLASMFPTQLDLELMTDLDPDTDANRFLYTWKQYQISALTAGDLGLYKQVKAQNDLDYSYSTTTNSGEVYSYKIRFATDAITQAKDLILFDALENYSSDTLDSGWHGILQSVDTTAMQALGVAPVVYYSTNPEWRAADPAARWTVADLDGLDPDNGPNYDFAAHADIWQNAETYTGDMADVNAIAVDLRFAPDGSRYQMANSVAASVTVYMKAPDTAAGIDPNDPEFKAYNETYLFNTVKSITEIEYEPSELIHQAYTQLGYRLIGNLKLVKIDQSVYDTTGELQPVQGIRFRLWGTSNYGTEVDRELTTNAIGEITFGSLELGHYNLQELDGIPDYQQNHIVMQVTVDEDGNAYIGVPTNDPQDPYDYSVYDGMIIGIRPTDGAYIIGNKPRVHADLDFWKKGRTDGSTSLNTMPNVTFKITGISAYGNRFSDEETPSTAIYVTTDAQGVAHVVNLEKSSSQGYTMVETQTISGYILSERVFKLYCDENGITMTYVDGGDEIAPAAYDPASGVRAPDAFVDGNGNYVVVNDAFHGFSVFKYNVINAAGISGATFSLTGDGYYQEATSAANGVAVFTALEPGSYTLQEIAAPAGFVLDDTIHVVTVDEDGSATMDGQTLDAAVDVYYDTYDNEPDDPTARLTAFPVANDPQTATITIVKYWEGLEDGETPPTPTLHLDAERPTIPGDFATISRAKWTALLNDHEEDAQSATSTSDLRTAAAFAHYTGNVTDPDANGWTRIDDEMTGKKVWYKRIGTTLYWYSDATTVYLPDDCTGLFAYCASMTNISTAGLNSSRVTSMAGMFRDCTGLVNATGTELDVSNLNTSRVESMYALFWNCAQLKNLEAIKYWDVSSVNNMSYLFGHCKALQNLDVSDWDTGSVTTMSHMFNECETLTSLDLHTHVANGKTCWNVGNVEKMNAMFGGCSALQNLNATGWNVSRVYTMHSMFYGCSNLYFKNEAHPDALDVSVWDTSRLVMSVWLFNKCTQATVLDLSGWDMSQIENASMMFQSCEKLTTIYGVGAWTIPVHTNNDTITHEYPDGTQVTCSPFTVVLSGDTTNTPRTIYSDALLFYGCTVLRGQEGTAYSQHSSMYNNWYNNPSTVGRDGDFARVDGYEGIDGYFTEPANSSGNRSNSVTQLQRDTLFSRIASALRGGSEVEAAASVSAGMEEPMRLPQDAAPAQDRSVQTLSGPITDQVSDPDGWTQNADGTWSYTFTVYDFDYTYYLWEGVLPGFTSDTYQPDGVVVVHYTAGGGLTTEPADRVIEYPAGNAPATYAIKVTNTKAASTGTVLTVAKEVTGGGDTTAYFDITITLSDTSINGLYGDVGFENGVATLSLRGGQSRTVTGLPQGITYTVTEPDPQGHTVSYTNGTGTIGADPITATVTNYKPDLPPPPVTGGFSILMTVEDEWISEGHRFSGSVTLYTNEECTTPATDINGLYGSLLFTNGTAPWMLVHGESVAASGLRTDLWYKVTENEEEGWQASYPENRTAQVSVTPPQAVVYNEKVELQTNGFTVDLVAEDFDGDPAFPVYVSMAGLTAGATYSYVITYADASTDTQTFTALSNGTATVTVNLRNGESAAFSELPIGATYTLSEPSGNFVASYTAENSGTAGGVVSPAGANPTPYTPISTATETVEAGEDILITFTNVNPKISVSGTKTWVDDNNSGDTRPDSITVYLMADGRQVRSLEVTEAADGSWSWTFENLDRFTTGTNGQPREIVYTIEEDEIPDYTATVNGYNVTNTLVTQPLSITATKVWDDNETVHPGVQVVVVRNGVDTSNVAELNEGNNWSYTFTGLVPADAYGTAYVYTVRELVPEGYSVAYSGDVANGFTITNTRVITVSGTKTWVDDSNNGNTRPTSITVKLYKSLDGGATLEQIGVTTADEANGWSWAWSGLPKYENGVEVLYSVDEESVPAGYTKTVNGYDITNTLDLTTITVVVHWDDANDQDGKRSGVGAAVQLYKKVGNDKTAVGDPVNVGYDQDWSKTWNDLPKFENGVEIQYSVEETLTTPNGYTVVDGETTTKKEIDVPFGGSGTITNHYTPETTDIQIVIHWDDANDQDGKRSGVGAAVQLYKKVGDDKTAVGDPVDVGHDQDWSKTWNDLPKYEDGVEIEYRVEETLTTPNGYTVVDGETILKKEIVVPFGGSGTITNHYDPETTSATVHKVWDDANDQDGKRPASLTVTLSNGATVTLNDGNGWTATLDDLPVYANGQAIVYTWTEGSMPDGYTLTNTTTDGTVTTLTNHYDPETTTITVVIHWDDANNQDGKRSGVGAEVQLYKTVGGVKTAVGDPVDVGHDQDWSKIWNDLPKYENGVEIEYRVEETLTTPNGYTVVDGETTLKKEIVVPFGGSGTITNHYDPETTTITVVIHWDDANNQDGKRSGVGAEVQLYKTVGGVKTAVGDPVDVGHDQDWSKIWNDLPKYENGVEIQYSVGETLTTPNGYTILGDAEIVIENGGSGTITNYHRPYIPTPATTSVKVSKAWSDDSVGHPDSVTVVLVRNGVDTTMQAVLSAANNWSYTFANLRVTDDAGNAYVYTVREEVPDGYTADYSGSAANGFVITNTKNAELPDEPTPLDPVDPTTELPDEPTPLLPPTGDEGRIFLWLALGAASLGGIVLLSRKRKEEEEA